MRRRPSSHQERSASRSSKAIVAPYATLRQAPVPRTARDLTMAYDALRTIMPIAGWPEERAREVEISVGVDPVLPTRFCIGLAGLLREGRAIPARDSTPDHQAIVARRSVSQRHRQPQQAISSATPSCLGLPFSPCKIKSKAGGTESSQNSLLEERGFEPLVARDAAKVSGGSYIGAVCSPPPKGSTNENRQHGNGGGSCAALMVRIRLAPAASLSQR